MWWMRLTLACHLHYSERHDEASHLLASKIDEKDGRIALQTSGAFWPGCFLC
ncbi:hypothetical protein B0H17DRAFT_1080056 [Mycena rosella]|uniref:Uncharacterized protein n=1 Tax=Mycena rosella TaxID=1033263 RepID=A0AAD7GAQ4_MYCRO|nr:hypothetical protein B0H17DRAFT_1080056 [Mycena rosella]